MPYASLVKEDNPGSESAWMPSPLAAPFTSEDEMIEGFFRIGSKDVPWFAADGAGPRWYFARPIEEAVGLSGSVLRYERHTDVEDVQQLGSVLDHMLEYLPGAVEIGMGALARELGIRRDPRTVVLTLAGLREAMAATRPRTRAKLQVAIDALETWEPEDVEEEEAKRVEEGPREEEEETPSRVESETVVGVAADAKAVNVDPEVGAPSDGAGDPGAGERTLDLPPLPRIVSLAEERHRRTDRRERELAITWAQRHLALMAGVRKVERIRTCGIDLRVLHEDGRARTYGVATDWSSSGQSFAFEVLQWPACGGARLGKLLTSSADMLLCLIPAREHLVSVPREVVAEAIRHAAPSLGTTSVRVEESVSWLTRLPLGRIHGTFDESPAPGLRDALGLEPLREGRG